MHFDFSLISANNGWIMAVTGAIIVMSGLSLLSLIISQLHKVVGFFEKKDAPAIKAPPAPARPSAADADLINDLEAAARLYKAVSTDLGATFPLSKLYGVIQRDQLPHPHLTIRSLREAGFLVPEADGKFTWQNC